MFTNIIFYAFRTAWKKKFVPDNSIAVPNETAPAL